MSIFRGTCDVCGADIEKEHDLDAILIDYNVMDDGRRQIWIRHYATAPEGADPNCGRYSSKVYEVDIDPELAAEVRRLSGGNRS